MQSHSLFVLQIVQTKREKKYVVHSLSHANGEEEKLGKEKKNQKEDEEKYINFSTHEC